MPVLRIFDNKDDIFIFSRNVRKSSARENYFKNYSKAPFFNVNLDPFSFFVNTPFNFVHIMSAENIQNNNYTLIYLVKKYQITILLHFKEGGDVIGK